MAENSDLEQVTGSPTAGENGFVHIESVDSARMDGGSINQDDGIVVTGVDTVLHEQSGVRMAEDGGNEEFVDCDDDLVSYDGRTSSVENSEVVGIPEDRHTLGDDTEDTHPSASNSEREIFPQDYQQEEPRLLMKELTNLCNQLKALNKQHSPIDDNDSGLSNHHITSETGEADLKSLGPLHKVINECSKFIELALNEQSQTEGKIRELHAALNVKDKEIDDLSMRFSERSVSHGIVPESNDVSAVEATASRILSSVATALGEEELSDTSLGDKLSHLEKSTSVLIAKQNRFLSEAEMLNQCLAEIKSDSHVQTEMETVFLAVREELLALKRKELEFAHKINYLEDENRKLMEQLDKGRETVEMLNAETGKLRGEIEQERARYGNTKEKLSMAVTKGKALVQQRDALKQSLAEKTSELEKCLIELQEKSAALEAAELRKEDLMRTETLANSLQDALSQRDMILEKCREILSLSGAAEELQSSDIIEGVVWLANERNRLAAVSLEFQKLTDALLFLELPRDMQFPSLESQVSWLLESYQLSKDQSIKLQEEIDTTRESARTEIDRLTASMLVEAQEKDYLQEEYDDLRHKYEGIVEEKRRISMEKEHMVNLLLDASGIVIEGSDDTFEVHSDMVEVIERCFAKIKEQTRISPESSPGNAELLQKIQNLLYIRDHECKLYEQMLEEEKTYSSELENRSNELAEISKELSTLKDENCSLQRDLQRSEEKASLLREKLSMAVKKGKGLVQERENMKQQMAEMNAQIEALKLDLQKQESAMSDCRDQIDKWSAEVERIPKLESDFIGLKEQKEQIEQFLTESNNMLQRVIEAIDGITLPVDVKEPVEKVNWLATYLSECEITKAQAVQDLDDVKDEASMLATKLTEALTTVKSLEDALSVSEKNISQLTEEKRELDIAKTHFEEELQKAMEECQVSKMHAERELGDLRDEVGMLSSKLAEALTSLKSLEDALSVSEKTITRLTEEKGELETAKSNVEEELHKAMEEASEVQEVFASKTSLQEALSLAENKISALMSEKEDAQACKVAAEMELQKVKNEASIHAINLDEAYKSIKSLEDAMAQLQSKVSQFSEENEMAQDGRTVLESEIRKLKEEVEYRERKFVDASATIKTLEDALLKAENTVSDLVGEKKSAEKEISILNTQLSACWQDLASKHDNLALELSGFFDNVQVLLKDGSLLALVKQSFEKKSESLKEMDRLLKDMKDGFVDMDSEQLRNYPAAEENFQSTFIPAGFDIVLNTELINGEFNWSDAEVVGSYVNRTLENMNLRNQILADGFGSFSMLIDEMIASLLKKLETVKNTVAFMLEHLKALQQNMNNMQMDKQELEHRNVMLERDFKVLLSACADATKELKFQVVNNALGIDAFGVEKSNHSSSNVRADDEAVADVKCAEDLLSAARNVRSLIEHYSNVKDNMSITIEELQGELENTKSVYEKAKEEYGLSQSRVCKLETELEASQNLQDEMTFKLEKYREKEDKWNAREAELSMRSHASFEDRDAENHLLSAHQIKSLFDKIHGITIPFPNLGMGDIEPEDSDPVKKLFYIVDSVNELLHQMTLLSHAKEELQSTISEGALEVEHLKGEFEEVIKDKQKSEKMKRELFELSTGLENIIQKLGVDEFPGGKKSADVAGLLPILERLVQRIVWDSENAKSKVQDLGAKLLETQKVAEELANKVKLLEDFNQSRTGSPDTIQERAVFESPSLPARSEISEIEDPGPVGQVVKPPVPSAAHARTLRKGSNDQLAINIDTEADRLVDKEETVEDKGHIFKSLHTSGLVPVQGKLIADRLDGIWVSGGRALMNRPRARLGLIAYWLVLHLWLLGTLL